MGIGEVFQQFCESLKITNSESIYRYRRITYQLNKSLYGYENDTYQSIYTGSYGRDAAIEGFSDLDMLFWLNPDDHSCFNNHQGNGKSAMLQEVRASIRNTYPSSDVSGDGHSQRRPLDLLHSHYYT